MHNASCDSGSCSAGACSTKGGCGSSACGCQQGGCGCSSGGSCGPCDLMDVVHGAKMCLLTDKVKTRLEAKIGKKLDAEADLLVETFLAKWQRKKEAAERKEEMMEKWQKIMEA